MSNKTFIIAHRGFSGQYPENTSEAVTGAISAGANIIEFDVQLSKDNEVVVFHDRTLDRIVPKKSGKKISDFSLNELKSMDFGGWFDSKFSETPIATLQELLEIKKKSSGKWDYIIEIKGTNSDELIPCVKDIVDKNNFSFSLGYLSVRDEISYEIALDCDFPRNHVGLMQKKRTPTECLTLAEKIDSKIIQLRSTQWTQADWENLQKSDFSYTIFFADIESEFKKYLQFNPYGLFTNFPNRLKKFLDNKN